MSNVTSSVSRPEGRAGTQALLLTVLGELVLPSGGSAWTQTLVAALGQQGISEATARQTLARSGDRGVVESKRQGRAVRWHLTAHGRELLETGAARIYSFGDAGTSWDGTWLVAVLPVPEDQRAVRHRARAQLGFAGFGFITPTVALCPHVERSGAAAAILAGLQLDSAPLLFATATLAFGRSADVIARGWDLDALAVAYREFIATFGAIRPQRDDGRAVALIRLVNAWRKFPSVDPEIPTELLPARWPGIAAKELFDSRRAAWGPGAAAWFEAAEAAAG